MIRRKDQLDKENRIHPTLNENIINSLKNTIINNQSSVNNVNSFPIESKRHNAFSQSDIINQSSAIKNLEEEKNTTLSDDKEKKMIIVNLPFNNKGLMTIIAVTNFLSGLSLSFYTYTLLFYMNNPNSYKKHLHEYNSTWDNATLTNKTDTFKENSSDYNSVCVNLMIFGIMQIICSLLAFIIRESRFSWVKDMIPYIIYESLGNICSLGSFILWFYLIDIFNDDLVVFNQIQTIIKYFSLLMCIACAVFKIVTLRWGFHDYFDVILIEDIS